MPRDVLTVEARSGNADWRRFVALVGLAALAMFVFCMVDQDMFADGDTNWHVATGRWILAHGAVPTTDPFSFSAYGHRWVAHEWLSEVLMALAWQGAGWSGVMLLTASVAALAVAPAGGRTRETFGDPFGDRGRRADFRPSLRPHPRAAAHDRLARPRGLGFRRCSRRGASGGRRRSGCCRSRRSGPICTEASSLDWRSPRHSRWKPSSRREVRRSPPLAFARGPAASCPTGERAPERGS